MARRQVLRLGAALALLATAVLLALVIPAPVGAQTAPPSIELIPGSGPQGTTFKVEGFDFSPGVSVAIRWDSPAATIGGATTGRSGSFATSVTAPAPSSVGGHVVVAECASCPAPQIARATFTVLNSPPNANGDKIMVAAGESRSVDVVANDTDVDGNIIGVTSVTQGAKGSVEFGGRMVTYTADGNAVGSDSFRYTICDEGQECDSATVDVTIIAPTTTTSSTTTTTTQPPTTTTTTTTTTTQPPTTTTSTTSTSTTTTTQPPTTTTTTTTRPPTTTTTTRPPRTTTTTSTSTTTTTTPPTTTTSTTRPDNARPEVLQDTAVTEPGTRVTVDPLANDRDPDGRLDPDSLTIVREPQHGSASVAGGRIAYRPDPGYEGEDSLVYRVCDDGGLCNAARVVFVVEAPQAPVTTTTTVPDEPCEIDPADVVAFTVDPPRGPPGIDVFLDLEVSADVVTGCLLPEVQFTFNGGALGPSVPLRPNPGASATVTVPADAPAGIHTVGATQLGAAPVELGTTEFEVIGAASSGGGIPGWLPPAAGASAALAAAALVFRRRSPYRHVPVSGGGECSSLRQRLLDARQEAARVGASADEAAIAATNARTAADGARADLLRCREGGAPGAGDDDMRMMGGKPPSQDAGEVGEGFHLLDYDNPNAPLQEDGHFGWYFPARAAAVSGVVLHVTRAVSGAAVEGPAMSVADTYSKSQAPRSVHAVVDETGAVPLLPDDYTALHTPGSDDESLAMEVVWEPAMGEDAEVLENAAAWFAAKVKQHGIPARQVTREEWLEGKEGIIGHEALVAGGDDLGFPWERFLDLVDAAEKLPQPVALRIHRRARQAADPCSGLSEQAHTAESGALTAEQEAGSLQAAALSAQSQVEAQREAVWDCECRTPAEEVPPTPEEDEPEHRRERFYLLEHENELAKMRANGKRGHYSTVRKGLIRGIVVHTAEGDDAAGVADYFATVKRAVSGHVVVDPQGWVKLLPDRYAAFHAKRANDDTLGLLFACHAADWGTDPVSDAAMLRLAAMWAGVKAKLYGIPLRRLTKAEWKAGERGFVAHSDIDRGFSDPGDGFDWEAFLAMAGGKLLTPR